MRSDRLPLARAAVDRDGVAREDPALLARLLDDPGSRVVLVHRGLVAVTAAGDALELVEPARLTGAAQALAAGGAQPVYLGTDADGAYLALAISPSEGDERDFAGPPADLGGAPVTPARWATLREVGATLADRDAGLAVTAVALAAWHARHPRCPRCGAPTEPVHAGWARRCTVDATLHHPRTDPAVIVAVTDDDERLLLAHAAHWPPRRFSLVAGYVEPGESLEAAARREVAEETGLVVTDLRYEGSQPWPFPASLMLGFRARLAGGALRPDGVEVTEAMLVGRAELTRLVADGDVLLPMRASIARVLIEEWTGGTLPGP